MIKDFTFRIAAFALILCAYMVGNLAFNSYRIYQNPPRLNSKTLIMGDSHLMTSLDPSAMGSCTNICQEAEPYLSTYLKLREISRHNSIDTIFMGFSVHNLADYNDKKFLNNQWSYEMFNRMYSIITLDDLHAVPVNKESYQRALVNNLFLRPKLDHTSYIGHFSKRIGKRKTRRSELETIDQYFSGISTIATNYLDSIVSLTHKSGIKLILINTPIDKTYYKQIPRAFHNHFSQMSSLLKLKNVTILDYSMASYPDSCFYDLTHLNYEGAKLFTVRIKEDLARPELSQDISHNKMDL
jgi:hypothetical protein